MCYIFMHTHVLHYISHGPPHLLCDRHVWVTGDPCLDTKCRFHLATICEPTHLLGLNWTYHIVGPSTHDP